MKTYKIIISGITVGAIVLMSINSTSAYGQGLDGLNKVHIPAVLNSDIEKQDLDDVEIYLSELVTREDLREKIKKGHDGDRDLEILNRGGKGTYDRGNMKRNGGNNEYARNIGINNIVNINKYKSNDILKQKYKNTYIAKYGDIISKMDDSKLKAFMGKIDNLIEKVIDGDYSENAKVKYLIILGVLRELTEENLDEGEVILDGLFK